MNSCKAERQIHDAEAQPQAEAFAHRSLFDWQPQISSNAFDRNWYGIRPVVAFEDEPFFASNLVYYPELPQPFRVSPYQSYRDWKSYHDARRTMQQAAKPAEREAYDRRTMINAQADTWQLLGENVYAWTQQPNGQPLVPLHSLAAMSGVSVACVLMAAHLIQHRHDPNENCMLTHFSANKLRSYVVMSDEVQDVLNRCERREHNLYNAVPLLCSPMAHDLPQPPIQWLIKPKLKPNQPKKRPKRQHSQIDARGHDKFINPNLMLITEWQPETSSYNYKLQSQ